MGRLFGTDGGRGVAGDDLTGHLAMDLAIAAAEILHETGVFDRARAEGRRPVAVVGRDPRASGEFLESAVVAGLAGAGVDVLRLGVIPTPAVAFLTADTSADLGVMLSASHNPAKDNGIKLFARGGFKLPDAAEDEIEARLGRPGQAVAGPPAGGFGRVSDDGVLTVVSSEQRSQLLNRRAARGRMANLIREAIAPPPAPRVATRPSRRARERRVSDKRRRGAVKRRPPSRALRARASAGSPS